MTAFVQPTAPRGLLSTPQACTNLTTGFTPSFRTPNLSHPTRNVQLATAATPTMMVAPPKANTYKIGLCLAGAATGGCYSAGVMDFLFEALTEWEKAKANNDKSVPQWNVDIAELAGTSAGGIASTLAVGSLNINFESLSNSYKLGDEPPKHNPMFATLVKELNCDTLLSTEDLDETNEGGQRVFSSALNGNFMSDTAKKVLADHGKLSELPKFADDLTLCLTATNMRGTPYSANDFNTGPNEQEKFYMRQHADWTRFYIKDGKNKVPRVLEDTLYELDIKSDRTTEDWQRAIDCVKATAAFPVGFPTVKIQTPRKFYEDRLTDSPEWYKDATRVDPGKNDPKVDDDKDLVYYAAYDGGCVNNEPFGLMEEHMRKRYETDMVEDEQAAWGSVILISPFPGQQVDPKVTEDKMAVLPALTSLVGAIRAQAMFKPHEIEGAVSESAMKRFMVRPARDVQKSERFPLATETMGSFGGIIDEKLRLHDYQLGRANCQEFLKNGFTITRKNALKNEIFMKHLSEDGSDVVPIIPLVGSAKDVCPVPEWPSFTARERAAVTKRVSGLANERIDKVLDIVFENLGIIANARWNPKQFMVNQVGRFAKGFVQGKISDTVEDSLDEAMDVFGKK